MPSSTARPRGRNRPSPDIWWSIGQLSRKITMNVAAERGADGLRAIDPGALAAAGGDEFGPVPIYEVPQ